MPKQLLAINYHYVGNFESRYPGVHGLPVSQFLEQLRWLRGRYDLIGLKDLLGPWEGLPDRACLITFDDGLRCHYDVIAALMEEHRFPAIFFILGRPLAEGMPTPTHMEHFVRANVAPAELLADALDRAERAGIVPGRIEDSEARRLFPFDAIETARLRYLLTYTLPREVTEAMIEERLLAMLGDMKSFCDRWFMSRPEVAEMSRRFDCIGSHGYGHLPLKRVGEDAVRQDLRASRRLLSEIVGKEVLALSYPFGGTAAVGPREGKIAAEVGYRYGFTMARTVNSGIADPLMISRMDCNDLPIGGFPMYEFIDGELVPLG